MPELLTTDEAAEYLRLSERKLYELVAERAVPCSKVTGRWLFPRAALDRWVSAGLIAPARWRRCRRRRSSAAVMIRCLEWALRESHSGLASLPEGSEEGLRRLTRGEVMIAAIHLHRLDGDDEDRQRRCGRRDAGTARCRRHCVCTARARHSGRTGQSARPERHGLDRRRARAHGAASAGAGAQLLLLALLARAGIAPDDLKLAKPAFATGPDTAQAVRAGRIDCGIATRSVALSAGLDFLPLAWERFDLVLRQRDYFMKGPQALFDFMRGASLRDRAVELGGYDVSRVPARCCW